MANRRWPTASSSCAAAWKRAKWKRRCSIPIPIERERGITIKAQSVSLPYTARDGNTYMLNFIDTPGHVDFSYEVSRSLAACEGALLVVDAAQGVEAQSVANCYTAVEMGLEVVPVLNKIDLPTADPERVKAEIEAVIGIDANDAIAISAKTGENVPDVLEAIVARIPPPKPRDTDRLQALIIDSWFDNYLGVVSLVRVMQGEIKPRDKILVMSTGRTHEIDQVGVFTPKRKPQAVLGPGEVGWVTASIKDVHGAPVGDTLTLASKPAPSPLPGFQTMQPRVFAGMFPGRCRRLSGTARSAGKTQAQRRRAAFRAGKFRSDGLRFPLRLSRHAAHGNRAGTSGARIRSQPHHRRRRRSSMKCCRPTARFCSSIIRRNCRRAQNIEEIREPIIVANILTPPDYVGNVIKLCEEKRGNQRSDPLFVDAGSDQLRIAAGRSRASISSTNSNPCRAVMRRWITISSGFQAGPFVRLDVLINGERVDALSMIVHRAQADRRGRELTERMKELIPRQMFDVAIQAAVGSQIIARTTVKALRKNVLAKCYGGDATRKRKLLEKQKAGKRRMKQVGRVEIPQEAFLAVLQVDK